MNDLELDADSPIAGYESPQQNARASRVSRWSVIICGCMAILVVGRLMELVPFLRPFRLGMVSLLLALIFAVSARRLTWADLTTAHGPRWFLAFACVGALSIPLSVWPGGALQEWSDTFVFNGLIFFLFLANMRSERDIRILSAFFVACISILGLAVSVFSSKLIIESGDMVRHGASDMYDPNDLALIMVVGIPIALAHFYASHLKGKLVWGAAVTLMCVSILQTASRGGFLGLCAIGLYFFFTRTPQLSVVKKVALIAVAVSGVMIASPQQLWQRMAAFTSGDDYNYQVSGEVDAAPGRLLLWSSALQLINPRTAAVGVGVGQLPAAMGDRYGKYFYMTAHNTQLQVLLETGIVGLIVFVGILYLTWKNNRSAFHAFQTVDARGLCAELPRYINVSLVGFFVCSQLLSRAYSNIPIILLAYSIALRKRAEEEVETVEEEQEDGLDGEQEYERELEYQPGSPGFSIVQRRVSTRRNEDEHERERTSMKGSVEEWDGRERPVAPQASWVREGAE